MRASSSGTPDRPPPASFLIDRTSIYGGSLTNVQGHQNNYTGNVRTKYHNGNMNIHNGPLHSTTYNLQSSGESGINALFRASDPGASHDSIERSDPPKCHPGTRHDILKNILSWLGCDVGEMWRTVDDDGRQNAFVTDRVLWMFGPLGAGKTAIAQTIAETSAKQGTLAASFFFSRGTLGRGTARHVFPTLAYQIAMNVPGVRDAIGQAVDNDPSIFHKSLDKQAQTLILDPLASVFSSANFQRSFLVIIDGLDECDSISDQRQIISCLASLVSDRHIPIPLRFLVLSRPEPAVQDALEILKFNFLRLYSTAQAHRDVETFLRSCFRDVQLSKKHSYYMSFCPEIWPSDEDIKALVKRSGGYFIYAATVLRFVDTEYYEPQMQLQIIMDSSAFHSDAFEELDNLYLEILSRIPNIRTLLRILGYILLARPPPPNSSVSVTPRVVEAVFGLRPGTALTTLRGLHSILRLGDSTQDATIECLHASFPDFLFDASRSGKFYIDSSQCHADIARGCISLMKRPVPVISGGHLTPLQSPSTNFILNSWAFHFRRACDKRQVYEALEAIDDARWTNIIERWLTTNDRRGYWECYDTLEDAIDVLQETSTSGPLRSHLYEQLMIVRRVAFRAHLRHLSTLYQSAWIQMLPAIASLSDISEFLLSLHEDGALSKLLGFQASADDWYDIRKYISILQAKNSHSSFTAFLNDAVQFEFFIEPANCHAYLADCCMRVLSSIITRTETPDWEVYFYALKHWAEHLSLSTVGDANILKHLQSTKPEKFLYSACLADITTKMGTFKLNGKQSLASTFSPRPRLLFSLLTSIFPQHNFPTNLAGLQSYVTALDKANITCVTNWLSESPEAPEDITLAWRNELEKYHHVNASPLVSVDDLIVTLRKQWKPQSSAEPVKVISLRSNPRQTKSAVTRPPTRRPNL